MASAWGRIRSWLTAKKAVSAKKPHCCAHHSATSPSQSKVSDLPIKRVYIVEGCLVCNACDVECPDVFHLPGSTADAEGNYEYHSALVREGAERHFESRCDQIHRATAGCCASVIGIEYEDGSHFGAAPEVITSEQPRNSESTMPLPAQKAIVRLHIEEGCIPCNACEAECPEVFTVTNDNTYINPGAEAFFESRRSSIEAAADGCPVAVIRVRYSDGTERKLP